MSFIPKIFFRAVLHMTVGVLSAALLLGAKSATAQAFPVSSVSVTGNVLNITSNGVTSEGTLNGFTFIGILDPTPCAGGIYPAATKLWNSSASTELSAVRNNFNGNTIRLQVAEDLLYEPASQDFSTTVINNYITTVTNAIALARSKGFAVIVSMQWETQASGTAVCDGASKSSPGHYGATINGIPGTSANNAWNALLTSSGWIANNFNNDSGILLEMYNEAQIGSKCATASDWVAQETDLQALLYSIRGDGANNILIVPSMSTEKTLDGSSFASVGGESIVAADATLTDTLATPQLAYGVHPYPEVTTGSCPLGFFSTQGGESGTWNDFDEYFGNVANNPYFNAPIILTEWFTGAINSDFCWDNNSPTTVPNGYTSTNDSFYSPTIASQFFTWLETAGPGGTPISLAGAWAFDAGAGYYAQDTADYYPTFFDSSFSCGVQVTGTDGTLTYEGPGQILANFFRPHSQSIVFAPISPMTYGVSPITLSATGGSSGNPVTFSIVSGPGTIAGSTLTVTGAGTIVVAANQAGNGNYAAAAQVTQSIVVNQATLTVTANSVSVPYGSSPTLTATITGFVNGDTSSVLSGAPSLATTATAASLPGTYPISIGLGTLSAANYNFTLIGGTVTVTFTAAAPSQGSFCNGAYNGTFNGNLTVSAGQTCIFVAGEVTGNIQQNGGNVLLTGVTVSGNVQIQQGGFFNITGGSSIRGNLQVQQLPASSAVDSVCGSNVQGDFQFQNNAAAILIGAAAPASCPGNTINGNLTIQNNTASVSAVGNTVGGNLIVQGNTAATAINGNTVSNNLQDQNNTAPTQVFTNVIGGNLQCQGNTAISGGGNTAQSEQGQCSSY
jgi:MBG domain (YGX type)